MEIFLLFVILLYLIWLQRKFTLNKDEFLNLHDKLRDLGSEMSRLRELLITKQKEISKTPGKEQKAAEPYQLIAPEADPTPAIPVAQKSEPPILHIETIRKADLVSQENPAGAGMNSTPYQRPFPESKPSAFQKWLKDNPDIEKFIGENLINKIGIAILVLGISFFVRYAIDQDWINKIGRVCIGLVCGIVLFAVAHRLRRNYHSFSSVLVGGGLSVFYFTIAYAFHQYHLISQEAAFAIMIIITAFAVLLSLLYDRIELGTIATVGGFITPFLVSRGEGNYIVLFTYLSVLNIGLIVLAYYKRWRSINFIAFFFTEIIYVGWIVKSFDDARFPYTGTFIFGCFFYLLFIVMNVIHHVVRKSKLLAFDFVILLSVNLFCFATGIYLLQNSGLHNYTGLFTATLGIINLALAYFFFKKSKADKNFIFLLIGITVTFISLSAPVQLKGHHITLFWSAELVVLCWLYQKSLIRLIKLASILVTILMLASLFIDWVNIYGDLVTVHPIIANKGFITGICSALSLLLYFMLMRKEADVFFLKGISNNLVRSIYFLASVIVFYLTGVLEIANQFNKRLPGSGLEHVYLPLYTVIFAIVLFKRIQYRKPEIPPLFILAVPAVVTAYYLINLPQLYKSELVYLLDNVNRNYFAANWFTSLLLLILLYHSILFIGRNRASLRNAMTTCVILVSLAGVTILSVEFWQLFIWLSYSDRLSIGNDERIYSKAGLSVVWGLSSFVIMWLGMKNRYKPLRIIALVIFGVTLIKLFAYDIVEVSPGGKILAFILLGVLFLIVSFMYQRLKKIIIDDVEKKD